MACRALCLSQTESPARRISDILIQHPASFRLLPSPMPIDTASKATSKTPIIRLQNVTKTYPNGTQALRNLNFALNPGDFYLLTGTSGSGKSTLLKLLYGEDRPSEGEIWIEETKVNAVKGNQLAMLRRRLGIVFQDYKLLPRRTVAENVTFVLWAQGYGRSEIDRRLPPALKMVGLQNKAHCFPEELSGGEQQRVSIARAIVATPPILLADEPTGNLDPDNSRQILNILKQLNKIGVTILMSTHDEALIRTSDLPILQLSQGQLNLINR